MILQKEQLAELAYGYEETLCDENGVFLLRFPKNLHDFIDDFQTFASTSAGVHLSFTTDADSLRLRFCVTNINDPALPCAFDIYEKGVFTNHIVFDPLPGQEQEVTFDIHFKGNMDIWLPIHLCMKLIFLECVGAVFCKKANAYHKKCLFIGDSITQGFQCEYPSLTVASSLSRFWKAEILNQGIGGYSFRKSFVQRLRFQPDHILVALGTNDISYKEPEKRDPEGFFEKLFAFYPNIPVTVITPYKRFLEYDADRMDDMKKRIASCCRERKNVQLIDGEEISPHVESFYADGLHPTVTGMQLIAYEALKKIHYQD